MLGILLFPLLLIPASGILGPAEFAPSPQGQNAAHEQEALVRRAERLRTQMERLLDRYAKEGRKDRIVLLREAKKYFESSKLLRKLNEASLALEGGQRQRALQTQREVLADFEKLIAILLDRRSVEDLEKDSREVERRLAELRAMKARQNELKQRLSRIRQAAATEAEKALTEGLRKLSIEQLGLARESAARASSSLQALRKRIGSLGRILEEAKELGKHLETPPPPGARTDSITSLSNEAETLLQRLEDLKALTKVGDFLAGSSKERDRTKPRLDPEETRNLLRVLKKGESVLRKLQGDRSGGILEEARKGLADLRLDLAKGSPMREGGEAAIRSLERAIREAGRSSRKEAKRLSDKARDLSATFAKGSRESRALKHADEELKKASEPSPEGERSSLERSESAVQRALRHLYEARVASGRKNTPLSARASGLAKRIEEELRSLERNPSPPPSGVSETLRKAASHLKKAAGDSRALPADLANGIQAIENARKRLQDEASSQASRNAERAAEAASGQKNLRKRTEQTLRALARASKEGRINPNQERAVRDRVTKALKAMRNAEKNLAEGFMGGAAKAQTRASNELERAARALERERSLRPDQKREWNRLAEAQERLAREILELARRIDPKKNPEARRALDRARSAASKANQEMREDRPREAEQAQAEAERKLDEAEKHLKKERDRYWRLRQEELLFRIKDEVASLILKQREINRKTLDVSAERGDSVRIPRRLRSRLRALSRAENELAGRARFLADNLEKERTIVFTYVLRSIVEDLELVGKFLGRRRPQLDRFVLGLQREILERMKMMKASLEEEIRRSKEERKDPQRPKAPENTNEGDSKPRLVPDDAELKMLKRLEEDTKARIQVLLSLIESSPSLELDLRNSIERLALRHAKVSDLFRRFLESRGIPGSESGGEKDEDSAKEKKRK